MRAKHGTASFIKSIEDPLESEDDVSRTPAQSPRSSSSRNSIQFEGIDSPGPNVNFAISPGPFSMFSDKLCNSSTMI